MTLLNKKSYMIVSCSICVGRNCRLRMHIGVNLCLYDVYIYICIAVVCVGTASRVNRTLG